jgi:hypothetical protein
MAAPLTAGQIILLSRDMYAVAAAVHSSTQFPWNSNLTSRRLCRLWYKRAQNYLEMRYSINFRPTRAPWLDRLQTVKASGFITSSHCLRNGSFLGVECFSIYSLLTVACCASLLIRKWKIVLALQWGLHVTVCVWKAVRPDWMFKIFFIWNQRSN